MIAQSIQSLFGRRDWLSRESNHDKPGVFQPRQTFSTLSCHLPQALLMNSSSENVVSKVLELTGRLGVDATIICAASKDDSPINLSAEIIEVSFATFTVIEFLTRAMPVDMREMWEVIGEHR